MSFIEFLASIRFRGSSSIAIILLVANLLFSHLAGAEEYCMPEMFRAECDPGEVILMERAEFGRMELGRCVTRNYGHVGCTSDVLPLLDQFCSGRGECHVSVSDPQIVRTQPCPQDLASYLDATYRCIPVVPITAGACLPPQQQQERRAQEGEDGEQEAGHRRGLQVIVETEGYISSSETWRTDCVVVFQMLPGQRLNLTLMDFSAKNNTPVASVDKSMLSSSSTTHCYPQYASIYEMTRSRSQTVCASTVQERQRHIFTSDSHLVQLRFLPSAPGSRFLLHFEVIGCVIPLLPSDFYTLAATDETLTSKDVGGEGEGRGEGGGGEGERRGGGEGGGGEKIGRGSSLLIVCNSTQEAFRLTCIDGKWTGQMMDCPNNNQDLPNAASGASSKTENPLPFLTPFGFSVLVTVAVSFVVIVYISILAVCFLLMRRRSRLPRRQQQQQQSKATRCVAVSNVSLASGTSSVLRSTVNPVNQYVTCGHSATGHHHHHHHLATDQCGHRPVKSFCANPLSRIQHWSTGFSEEAGTASVVSAAAVAMDNRAAAAAVAIDNRSSVRPVAHSCAPLDAGKLKLVLGPRKAVVVNEKEDPLLSSKIMNTASLDPPGKVQHPSGKVQHPGGKGRKDIGLEGTVFCAFGRDPGQGGKDFLGPVVKDLPDKREKDLLNQRGKNTFGRDGKGPPGPGGKYHLDERGEDLPGPCGTATDEELSAKEEEERYSYSQCLFVSGRRRRTLEMGNEAMPPEKVVYDEKDPREVEEMLTEEDMEEQRRLRTNDRGRSDADGKHDDQILGGADDEQDDDDDDDDDDRLHHPDLVIDSCVKRTLVV